MKHARYDARDHLIQVKDPKGLITEYVYDGLGDLRELRSPDTGTTVYTYDAAGNRLTQTDARGVVTNYVYDALNRLTAIQYPADSSLNVSFAYDTVQPGCTSGETYATGRLTGVTDPSGSTTLCFDARGNVTRKALDDGFGSHLVSRYRHTLGDRLAATIYPGGLEVELLRDGAGRISGLQYRPTSSDPWQPLVTGAHYRPFGPLAGFSFGNGRSIAKDYDGNYAIDALASSATDGLNLDFEVDVLGNIIAITPTGANNPEQERHYDYDRVYRLTEVRDANQALIEAFTYDRTGNRLSQQIGTDPAQPYGYPANSHRLTAVDGVARTYDAAGNLTAILSGSAHPEFQVGANNRLQAYRHDGQQLAGYVYNGQGERACKWLGSDPIRYVYDTGGRLLGEYDASGNALAEYVYLDTLPVAVFAAGGLAYIETDHLGTPRVVVDAASNLALWRWPLTGSAFGEHAPDEDPHSTGTPYTFNLRFPGQYFDAESGLHYNYFRDYEPGTGRYIQSDPIGLNGGLSTFSYAGGHPLLFQDPLGLYHFVCVPVEVNDRWDFPGGFINYTWTRRDCVQLPPPPPPPRPDPCANDNCLSCYTKCVNAETIFGAGRTPSQEAGQITLYGTGVAGGGASAALSGGATAATVSGACGVIAVGVGTFELAARVRCGVVCSLNPRSY